MGQRQIVNAARPARFRAIAADGLTALRYALVFGAVIAAVLAMHH